MKVTIKRCITQDSHAIMHLLRVYIDFVSLKVTTFKAMVRQMLIKVYGKDDMAASEREGGGGVELLIKAI